MARGFSFAVIPILPLLLMASGAVAGNSPRDPQVSRWWDQLEAADNGGDSDSVVELARRILTKDPHDKDAWTKLVQNQIKEEDYDRALACLNAWEQVARHPAAEIDAFRGKIFLAQHHPVEAEKAWRASLAMAPEDYNVLSELADLLEKQERWVEVLQLRTRAADAKPTAALFAAKAGALMHLHQWDAANATIKKANQLDASDPTVQQWLPKIELLAKVTPRLKALDGMIAANPKDIGPLLEQAEVLTDYEEPSIALPDAKRALELDPGSVRARIQAGEAALNLHLPLVAAKFKVSHDLVRDRKGLLSAGVLEQLSARDGDVSKNPGKAQPLAARSKTLRGLKQYVLALDDAEAALRCDPNSPEGEFEMGHDLDALGRPGEALPHIIHATDLRPTDPVAWYYRGVIEANRADFHAAIASQTRSLAIRDSRAAREARQNCELRLGLATEAASDSQAMKNLPPAATP